ncbi:MAG: cytidylate kinase-like family protein [Bacteroidales bacterium]|nr:cytidylate kinase-like family protein [Bacteroidales bacterium]
MNKIIITINRQCGSGGGEIAKLLGENLGLKVYDRELLESIAKSFDMTIEHMEQVKSQRVNWWSDFCRFYQQFGAAGHTVSAKPDVTPLSLYYAEARALRELAEKESCIIVERAGFHIFRDNPEALHLFISADRESRIARVAAQLNIDLGEAEKTMDRIDKGRDNFVKNVTDSSRYDLRNYDFVFNVTGRDVNSVSEFLANNIRLKMNQ